jgi:hypothetical protein
MPQGVVVCSCLHDTCNSVSCPSLLPTLPPPPLLLLLLSHQLMPTTTAATRRHC